MKNISKREIIVIIVLFLLVLGFSFYYNYSSVFGEMNSVCFEERCFIVEIANNDEERQKGLMFRESLARDAGMFFVFERPGRHGFWMKNTLISLDIIWISEDQEVVYIKEDALPCGNEVCLSINPTAEALYVLEINSGLVEKLGIKVGDEVEFRNV